MKKPKKQSGFSAVELLITLTIAAAFLISGFQLYGVVIKDGGESRAQARAISLSNEYLSYYKDSIKTMCDNTLPDLPNNEIVNNVSGLANVKRTVTITCPYGTTSTVSKILVNIKYGNDSPQKEINNATFFSL